MGFDQRAFDGLGPFEGTLITEPLVGEHCSSPGTRFDSYG